MPTPRPGGRTAETRARVFEAARALLLERGPADLSMTEIAKRAGVAATSLYRRWGDLGALLMEVAVAGLVQDKPLPDTGSLDGDLRTWARAVAGSLKTPDGSMLFRVLVATAPAGPGAQGADRLASLNPRLEQIRDLLDRAAARGETAPAVWDVTDHVLAPLYFRTLFGAPPDEAVADMLVDRLLEDRSAAFP